LRDAAGEFDDLDAADTSPSASSWVLPCSFEIARAMSARVRVEQFLELEHEARALQRRRVAPGRQRGLRGRRPHEFGGGRQRQNRGFLAGRRVEDRIATAMTTIGRGYR
jgi:hypothetical protein